MGTQTTPLTAVNSTMPSVLDVVKLSASPEYVQTVTEQVVHENSAEEPTLEYISHYYTHADDKL